MTLVFRMVLGFAAAGAQAASSRWVSVGPDGHLVYATTPRGDRIMDFSSAGFGGGGVPIPRVAAAVSLTPSGADDTAAVQAAIDRVERSPESNGWRGAVELGPGSFRLSEPVRIAATGVVLRGAGSGAGGTVLVLTGRPHGAIEVTGMGRAREHGPAARIVDRYVPEGTATVTVADASGFRVGEPVLVLRPVTPQWVRFMGMARLRRDGRREHWAGGVIRFERTIRAIEGNRIRLDIPLSDALDAAELTPDGAALAAYDFPGRISRVGVEDLAIQAPEQHTSLQGPMFRGVHFAAVQDAWMRDVTLVETMNSVSIDASSRRITLEGVGIRHSTAIIGRALPADFEVGGSQVLIERCAAAGDREFYIATGAETPGPNVALGCVFEGNGAIQPHQRWATGLLVDNCRVPDGSIDLMNRGEMGSGHGWAIGWGVAWNCDAERYLIQQPPGSMNWCIGCVGAQRRAPMPVFDGSRRNGPLLPQGTIDSPGRPVAPQSLYAAQLAERERNAR